MTARCSCGSDVFRVRANATQQVGLATCERDHHALLLDSRDVWAEVIQEGRPKAVKCRCKADTFRLSFDYERDEERVRGAAVHATCTACGTERTVYSIEVDYEPTDELVDRPLNSLI